MQIYKDIPIITAQPTKKDISEIPHFLYGFAENNYNFSFGRWVQMLKETLLQVNNLGYEPIIVGGTMMYAYLLLSGYSDIPEVPDDIRQKANELYDEIGHEEFLRIVEEKDINTPKDKQRLVYNYTLLEVSGYGLNYYATLPQIQIFQKDEIEIIIPQKTRQEVYKTCNGRFLDMLNDGLVEEIESVINDQLLPIKRATGFYYIVEYLKGVITKQEMIEKSQQETRNYAKRQIIWLRKFAKEHLISLNLINNL
jgi:tRNA dimethylallyltransferase